MIAVFDESFEGAENVHEKSKFEIWFKEHNFAFSVILEFLKLKDIVKILTINHTSRLKFAPSPTLLSEIIQKSLMSSSAGIPFHSTAKNTLLPLLMISENKTLTMKSI
jgi:hypothetical protein